MPIWGEGANVPEEGSNILYDVPRFTHLMSEHWLLSSLLQSFRISSLPKTNESNIILTFEFFTPISLFLASGLKSPTNTIALPHFPALNGRRSPVAFQCSSFQILHLAFFDFILWNTKRRTFSVFGPATTDLWSRKLELTKIGSVQTRSHVDGYEHQFLARETT